MLEDRHASLQTTLLGGDAVLCWMDVLLLLRIGLAVMWTEGFLQPPSSSACKGQDGAQLWGAGASLASCRLGSGSVQLAQLLARKSCRLMLEVVGVQDL